MSEFFYHARYALRLWWIVSDMSLAQAWRYSLPLREDRDDPVEDADIEISYMGET